MKHKVSNFDPDSLVLESQNLDKFVMKFTEYRGQVAHEIKLHLDADWIVYLVYRLGKQVEYMDAEIARIKDALRNAGGAQ